MVLGLLTVAVVRRNDPYTCDQCQAPSASLRGSGRSGRRAQYSHLGSEQLDSSQELH
jgi:hypothetical protein